MLEPFLQIGYTQKFVFVYLFCIKRERETPLETSLLTSCLQRATQTSKTILWTLAADRT